MRVGPSNLVKIRSVSNFLFVFRERDSAQAFVHMQFFGQPLTRYLCACQTV